MEFTDIQQKTTCPYNKNHVFDKEKFMFHLNRCKDRIKKEHLFKKCRYNAIHHVPSEDIDAHQLICPDKSSVVEITRKLKSTFDHMARKERDRSREKYKKQEGRQRYKEENVEREERSRRDRDEERQRRQEEESQSEEPIFFEDCGLCRNITENLQMMKESEIPGELKNKIITVEKLIKKYYQLCKLQL